MRSSSIPEKLLKVYMAICTLLAMYYVISGLISNFENTNDLIFYFIMPFYFTDNLLPDNRNPLAFGATIFGSVFFGGFAIYAFVNQIYLIFIILLGWFIPCSLYGMMYITERDKNHVEHK